MIPEFLLQFLINWFQVGFTIMLCVWSIPLTLSPAPARICLLRLVPALQLCEQGHQEAGRSDSHHSSWQRLCLVWRPSGIWRYAQIPADAHPAHEPELEILLPPLVATSWMCIRLEVATAIVLGTVAIMAVFLRESTSEIAL